MSIDFGYSMVVLQEDKLAEDACYKLQKVVHYLEIVRTQVVLEEAEDIGEDYIGLGIDIVGKVVAAFVLG
jgi:hypothetical protein